MSEQETEQVSVKTAGQIAKSIGKSKTAVNNHVKQLIDKGVISFSLGKQNTKYFDVVSQNAIVASFKDEKTDNISSDIIDVLKAQIEQQNKEIDELHQLLNQEQQLHKQEHEQVLELETKVAKKHWWNFFKG